MTDRDYSDDHTAPTGVRAILAALPDPGPMPAEVIERINATLAAEYALRHTPPDTLADRRHRLGARLPALALAASVVVLAGVVVLALLSLTGGLTPGGSDTVGSASAAAPPAGAVATDGDAGAASPESARAAATEDSSGEDDSPTGEDGESTLPMSTSAAPIFASAAQLTPTMIAGHAATLRERARDPQDQQLDELPTSSRLSSLAGASDCLSLILEEDSARLVTRLVAIDFVDYDGADAAMILLRDAEPAADRVDTSTEPMTAYLVPADCGITTPRTLTDPVRLDP